METPLLLIVRPNGPAFLATQNAAEAARLEDAARALARWERAD